MNENYFSSVSKVITYIEFELINLKKMIKNLESRTKHEIALADLTARIDVYCEILGILKLIDKVETKKHGN